MCEKSESLRDNNINKSRDILDILFWDKKINAEVSSKITRKSTDKGAKYGLRLYRK